MSDEQGEALAHLVSIGFDPADITPRRLMIEVVRKWVHNWQDVTLKGYGRDDPKKMGVLSLATVLYADVPRFVDEALRAANEPLEEPK